MSNKVKHRHRGLWITLTSLLLVIVVSLSAFFLYASGYERATQNALNYPSQHEEVKVTKAKNYSLFEPKVRPHFPKGFIFYPGGRVETEAYFPLMVDLAEEGITSILIHMPLNFAFNDIQAAKGKQDLFPQIHHWYLGGHSLGGAMAATYLSSHSEDYDGLILLASYSTKDLSQKPFSTLSLLAEHDHVLNKDKYENNKKHLPHLTEHIIQGGIHSYFGDYGIQKGDGTPEITATEQRDEAVKAIATFTTITSIAHI